MDRRQPSASGLAALWRDPALRIAGIFAVIAAVWIVLSDWLLLLVLAEDVAGLSAVQTAKGLAFIAFSTVMIFLLVRRATRHRERAEAALNRSQERFDLIVEGIDDYSISLLDRAGRIVSWNRGAERITGYRAVEVAGRPLDELYSAEDRAGQLPLRLLEQARTKGRASDRGWRVGKDGRRFLADITITALRDAEGRIEGFVNVARDVTEQQAVADELRNAQERLTLALQSGDVGLWDMDLSSGELYVSPEWKRQLGYADDELPTHPGVFTQQLHPDDLPRVLEARQRAVNEPGTSFDVEVRLKHRDGGWRWIHTRGRVLRDDAGQAVRMIGVHTDVTERRETEAKLRQAMRMEAIGQLTGGVAHDFNNLLTVVLGNAELLADRLGGDATARQLAETTLAAAERGAALTRRLLAFARQETLVAERVDPNRLISGILPLLVRTLGEDVEIATDLGADMWELEVDPHQFENCLINLAVNARDALPGGGHVVIATRRRVLRAGDGVAAGEYVEIVVLDDGCGMPPEVRERAFEPFFTTKDVGKGSGLGLSMVYGFVRQSGGQVEIESAVGQGTTVRLLLPRAHPLTGDGSPSVRPERAAAGQGERILVVEDDPAVRQLMAGLLLEQGYAVLEAADGPQALDLARQAGELDLVVTDMVMPGGMNGAALATSLRQERPLLPVLYVSGYSDRPLPGLPADAEPPPGEADPVDRNLGKPFTRRALARAVRRTLDAARAGTAAG